MIQVPWYEEGQDIPKTHEIVQIERIEEIRQIPTAPFRTKKIDNFIVNLDKKLGQGSFGEVFYGQQKGTNKQVAVKMVKKTGMSRYMQKALMLETKIFSSLKSPNIVECYEVMETGNNYYIFQQYCPEGDLRAFMNKYPGGFSERIAIDMLKQICNGFVCMINEGIIHRDLKPENILVKKFKLKICDFGFSKKVDNLKALNNSLVGTPNYMSPQLLKRLPYTSKCDIWALGVIFFQLLHGRLPFQSRSVQGLISLMNRSTFLPSHKLSQKCIQVLEMMLQQDESKRADWNTLLSHHIFNDYFKLYFDAFITLENRYKTIMNQLRFAVMSQSLNLFEVFSYLQQQCITQLTFKNFQEFFQLINFTLTTEELRYMFNVIDIDNSSTVSLEQFYTALQQNNIPIFSQQYTLTVQTLSPIQPIMIVQQVPSSSQTQSENFTQSPEYKIWSAMEEIGDYLRFQGSSLEAMFNYYGKDKKGYLILEEYAEMLKTYQKRLTEQEIANSFKVASGKDKGKQNMSFKQFEKYFQEIRSYAM